MNQELLSRAQQKDAASVGAEARSTSSQKRQLNRISDHGSSIRNLSANGKALLHTADPSALPRKIAQTGISAIDTTTKSTVSIFKSAFDTIKNTIETKGINPNIKNISFSLLGGLFGLNAIKKLLDIPKLLTNSEMRDKNSPLIIDAAKLLTGSALTLGLFKSVLGGSGLGPSGLVFGTLAFVGLNALSSLYENPNGIFSKLAKLLGIRDKAVSLMDTVKFESISENNVENNTI